MAKDKRAKQKAAAHRRNGLKALKQANYTKALEIWEGIEPQELQPIEGIAEGYFRRGLKWFYGEDTQPQAGLNDLKKAFALNPTDACYALHYGLAAHHQDMLEEAVEAYQVAIRSEDEKFVKRAAYPLALALQQQGKEPSEDPVWGTLEPIEQSMLNDVSAFSRRPYTLSQNAPLLWQGIVALDQEEQEAAYKMLSDTIEAAANPAEKGLARYYLGVLAMGQENFKGARKLWTRAYTSGLRMPHLEHNLAQIYHTIAESHLEKDQPEDALAAANEANRHKTQSSLDELISQARQRIAYKKATAGNWREAKLHWEEAYEMEGNFRQIYNLALAYEHDEEFTKAGEAWREVLRRRPRRDDHPDALTDQEVSNLWARAAEAYLKAGDFDEAIRVYRHAVKYNPDNLETRHHLANGLANVGRLQAAENEYERILERDPKNIKALLRQGELAESRGSWQNNADPTIYWEAILDIDPENIEARHLLSGYYVDQAEDALRWHGTSETIRLYKEALEYQPDNSHTMVGLGHYYLVDGNEEQAQEYLDQAIINAPQDLMVYEDILRVWLQNEELDCAWQVLEEAEENVSRIPGKFYISQVEFCLDRLDFDFESVHPLLKRAEEHASPDYPILAEIGELAINHEALEIGKEYLDRAVKQRQHLGRTYLNMGIYYAAIGNFREAERYWNRAEKIARRERNSNLLDKINFIGYVYLEPNGVRQVIEDIGPGIIPTLAKLPNLHIPHGIFDVFGIPGLPNLLGLPDFFNLPDFS